MDRVMSSASGRLAVQASTGDEDISRDVEASAGGENEAVCEGAPKAGLGFYDLRRANATGLVAAGVDVKTAQGLPGHSDSRLTLDHYAQVVTELGELAAKAMGERFLTPPRDGR